MSDMVRMKVTVIFEYDADPMHYPDGKKNWFSMAEVDQRNFCIDSENLTEAICNSEYHVKVEPINGND